MENLFKNGMIVILFSLIVTFFVWAFMPKPHVGYYLEIADGRNSNQVYPIYKIMNN